MKKILITIALCTLTISSGHCKPGGWFWDFMDRSSISVNNGYCQPVYYQQPQVYYRQPQVYYRQPAPVYYQPAPVYYQPAPVYYQQPSYRGSSFYYEGSRHNRNDRHCR